MFKIRKAIRDVANVEYPKKLSMSLAGNLPLSNHRCHYNAVQAVKNNLAVGVVEAVIIYDDCCTVHFVNLMADGSFVDYTLGQMCINDDYRFVRHVSLNEYDSINDALLAGKKKLQDKTPWHIRKLIKLSKEDWC
jgi:hypothetical protein|nr:MAG TPA: hypothetical protein [Caudoviricetes sp.]